MSMDNFSKGVLDTKEHCLRCKDKAIKSYDVLRHIQLYMSKYDKNEESQSIMPNCCLNVEFQKSGPTYRRQVVNSRHQTPQGQSVAKPVTPLYNILVEYLDVL